MQFEILGVHTEEVARKKRRLVAARTAANLHDDILAVLGVLGEQHQFDFLFEGRNLRLKFVDLGTRHLFEFGVGLVEKKLLRLVEVRECFLVFLRRG